MQNKTKIAALLLLIALLATACGEVQEHRISYTLKSSVQDGKLVFVGVGGNIDGQIDPTLSADVGDEVTINLTSGDGAEHNISLPDFQAESPRVSGSGNAVSVKFDVDKAGSFPYFSTEPGEQEAGMRGDFL